MKMEMSGSGKRNTGDRRQESGVAGNFRMSIFGLIFAALIIGVSLTGCGGGGGTTPSYNVIGVGVIMKSRSALLGFYSTGKSTYLNPAWKRIDLSLGSTGVQTQAARVVRAYNADPTFLSNNVSFIFLTWDQVSGAGHYQVFYNQTKVWDSDTVNTDKDPAFVSTNPQAYLDLDDELSEGPAKITDPGCYEFQVVALNGTTVVAQLPKVTASLGMFLGSLPEISDFTLTTPNLTWNEVTATTEYKITISGVSPFTVNNGTVSYNVSTILSTSDPQNHYDVWVDARYLDGGGNPVEITRGIAGFNY